MMSTVVVVAVAVVLAVATVVNGDVSNDTKECAPTLATLATCLPFVSERSTIPTKDCCKMLDKVVDDKPMCLCALIKDHDAAVFQSYNIDLDNAVALAARCGNTKADINRCPGLLNLDRNSPEAKIFKVYAAKANATTGGGSMGATPNGAELGQDHSGGARGKGWWLGIELILGVWAYYCLASLLMIL